MKILHTADLHLGAPMRTALSPRESKLRREELLSSFLRLLQTARRVGCSAFIIAGDLFDSEAAAASLASTVFDAMAAYAEIDFFYLRGNHEGDFTLPKLLPKNLNVFENDWSYFEKENVVFFGKERLSLSDFENISLHSNKTNILIAHGSWASGYSKGADIPLGFIEGKHIDYCALGHYHTYAKRRIDERGIAVYAGTPEGRGFDEQGPKGAVLIDVTSKSITHEFLPLARRTLHSIEVDISEAKSLLDVFSLCEDALTCVKAEDLVRLVLIGKRRYLLPIDAETPERHFRSRFYHLEAEDISCAAPDIKGYWNENSLHGEFVRTVEADPSLSEEQRLRILSLGLAALNGTIGGDAG